MKTVYTSIFTILLTLLLGGCTDDMLTADGDVREGEPVLLSLDVEVPSMNELTRADIASGLDNQITSLWIGVYNAASGQRTGEREVPKEEIQSVMHDKLATVSLQAKTGRSYIVAVANYEKKCAQSSDGVLEGEPSIIEALHSADTWAKFNDLSVMWDTEGDIHPDVPLNALLMSGHYMEGKHADGSYAEVQSVMIPKSGQLAGAVHLRRIISQVRFNVTYDTQKIKDFEVISWTVHNVPNQTWLAEQTAGVLNAGDLRTVGNQASYQDTPTSNITEHNGDTWSFDWWQLENKRTGRDPGADMSNPYNYREEEYKQGGMNTGKYKALVSSADDTSLNNNATFLELRVRMTLSEDENGQPISGTRVFDGVYTVHLGYCEGDSQRERAMDFSAMRNTKYTYNVTINGVNDVMVEARKQGEKTPGAEGIVSDVTDHFVQLDAHYGQYNIYMTADDLSRFEYLIRAYDANHNTVLIDSKDTSTVPASGDKRKYLDWVEIRPTTSLTTFAEYKPRTGANSDGKTYTLDQFKAGVKAATVKAGYYTVFFNEYVYETATDGNETGSTAWRGYVNQPDRQLWIRVEEARSHDGESIYFTAKYAFSQKSIQTYYNNLATTALGIEHSNESYGLNLRNSTKASDPSADNGRFNVAQAVSGNNFSDGSSWNNDSYKWSDFVNLTVPQTVNAINNQGVSRPAITLENPLPVPATKQLSAYSQTKSDYDPDLSSSTYSRKYIDAVYACMNRNRDLDGDGKIDASEIRWYLPTDNIYTRIILGRRSLTSPIMDYAANPTLRINDSYPNNNNISKLFIYGSNDRKLWAMEGVSTSGINPGDGWSGTMPWNVRCVRNFGTNLTTITKSAKVEAAYQQVKGQNRVDLTYYDTRSVRQEKISHMIPHDIADQDYNRCYKAFEYSDEMNFSDLTGYTEGRDWVSWLINANPCSVKGEGWRVPNQKELAILLTLGLRPYYATYMLSATFSHYNSKGNAIGSRSDLNITDYYIMCITNSSSASQRIYGYDTKDYTGYNPSIRCVKDVD